jgi:spore coat polysaccharide biosynthesis protein SpsF (cytidylyltransferase family)
MELTNAVITARLSRDNLRLIQSTTEQDHEHNSYQVLNDKGQEVFTGTMEDVVKKYPFKPAAPEKPKP